MLRIGVFGGTFDPIHVGHLAAAERVRCDLEMDQIIFVPAHIPPHKPGQAISLGSHRLQMVKLSISDNPYFTVSGVELERKGRSFTVDTMASFRQSFSEDELFFIMGMDSLLELMTWKDVDRLAGLCRLVVVTRPGYELEPEDPRLAHLPSLVWKQTLFLQVSGLDIASRELRERIRKGQSVRYLILPEVEAYIKEHKLYETRA